MIVEHRFSVAMFAADGRISGRLSFLFKLEERIPVSVVSADESGCVPIRFSRQQREENRLAPLLSMLKSPRKGVAAQTFAVDPVSGPGFG
jgi:hypothetical protein